MAEKAYAVEQQEDGSWAVVLAETGEPLHCEETREQAEALARAMEQDAEEAVARGNTW